MCQVWLKLVSGFGGEDENVKGLRTDRRQTIRKAHMTFKLSEVKVEVPTRDHNRYNFGKSYIAHHYFIVSSSDLCTGVKKILKKNQETHWLHHSPKK